VTEIELLTPKECAQYRRCSVRKLDRERADGRGSRYVRIDGRIYYLRGDVDRFINAHICGGDIGSPAVAIPSGTPRHSRPRKNCGVTDASVCQGPEAKVARAQR
jgi:hypothetical protein